MRPLATAACRREEGGPRLGRGRSPVGRPPWFVVPNLTKISFHSDAGRWPILPDTQEGAVPHRDRPAH
eukprot:7388714-Prymnesium_polylepis.1